VLYDELVGFVVITAGIRFKTVQVEVKTTTSADTEDSTFKIDEPPFTELELQHLLLSLVQPHRIK
jgi:hypothetical protein